MVDRPAEHWAALIFIVLVLVSSERWVFHLTEVSALSCRATVVLAIEGHPERWICPRDLPTRWPERCGDAPAAQPGQRLALTEACELTTGWLPGEAQLGAGLRLDINTATWADLQAISGIGPALATRVVEGRPYGSVMELKRVRGIGAKTLRRLAKWVRVAKDYPASPDASAHRTPQGSR